MDRKQAKREYLAYREAARRLHERVDQDANGRFTRPIEVPLTAAVWPCEDGAFVEAVVWVPRRELALQRKG